ncbi:MAG: phosphate ABC transporter ATP-binding protein, partial [Candidatus Thorarchaeota archaeon]
MAVISLTGVTVEFDSTRALDHIDLRVEPGEVLSIIGPNGAGKTTLLRVMAGLQRPSSGLLSFRGRAVTDTELPEFRRRVTMVFQKPILFGTTVFNNVAYGLRIRGVPETEVKQRVTAALEEVGMHGLAGRQARTLSGGEQKRVALAMARVTQPDVILLDEPTAYLDRDGVALVDDIVQCFRREGHVAVAIATHDILRVAHLSDQTLILDAGRIRAKGQTREVIREDLESLAFGDLT